LGCGKNVRLFYAFGHLFWHLFDTLENPVSTVHLNFFLFDLQKPEP